MIERVWKCLRSLRARGLQVHGTFTLAPGPYTLRFLVRETDTGRVG